MARSTLTMPIKATSWEQALKVSQNRLNALYDSGYISEMSTNQIVLSELDGTRVHLRPREFEVTFAGLGNYIGPVAPPDTLEEISG
jgi:hypothetical protein